MCYLKKCDIIGVIMKVSVIICYTNIDLMQEVSGYIKSQSIAHEVEIIGIDNRKNDFSSSAKALNFGADKANGDVLVFMHQDVLLEDPDSLKYIYDYLMTRNNLTFVGIAGAQKEPHLVCSAITETRERIVRYAKTINEPTKVETLDECLLAITSKDFQNNRFDEKTCDNWHLYGVDLSLSISLKGGDIICLPIKAVHLSKGNVNKGYYKSLKKVIKKYKNKINYIYTTCGAFKVKPWTPMYIQVAPKIVAVLVKLKIINK